MSDSEKRASEAPAQSPPNNETRGSGDASADEQKPRPSGEQKPPRASGGGEQNPRASVEQKPRPSGEQKPRASGDPNAKRDSGVEDDKRTSQSSSPRKSGALKPRQAERKRKDGTRNKMSFDVDELEEGLYVEVEDEDVEEVVEYEEVPDDEPPQQQQEGAAASTESEKRKSVKGEEGKTPAGDESSGYKIRPDLAQKFRPGTVQVIIEKAIRDQLENREYSPEECEEWTRLILEDIHEKVKSQNYKRYKIITHVTLGERRGEGASSATRCLWDAEADCMATYTFLSDAMFCNGTVYGIYFY